MPYFSYWTIPYIPYVPYAGGNPYWLGDEGPLPPLFAHFEKESKHEAESKERKGDGDGDRDGGKKTDNKGGKKHRKGKSRHYDNNNTNETIKDNFWRTRMDNESTNDKRKNNPTSNKSKVISNKTTRGKNDVKSNMSSYRDVRNSNQDGKNKKHTGGKRNRKYVNTRHGQNKSEENLDSSNPKSISLHPSEFGRCPPSSRSITSSSPPSSCSASTYPDSVGMPLFYPYGYRTAGGAGYAEVLDRVGAFGPQCQNPHHPPGFMVNVANRCNHESHIYPYLETTDTVRMHIITNSTPPWLLDGSEPLKFKARRVPTCLTIGELLHDLGATNPDPSMNKCCEVFQGSGGKWQRGIHFDGSDHELMKKKLRDIGWDSSRNGEPNGKPLVCLYLTKD